tara:strand:+ start:441 stop:569 length:129 start_codon:yes stop_codon:yes gene_type:complete
MNKKYSEELEKNIIELSMQGYRGFTLIQVAKALTLKPIKGAE